MTLARITSRANPRLRHVEKLAADAGCRAACGQYVCEGEKLLREALAAGVAVAEAVWDEDALPEDGTAPAEGPAQACRVPHELYGRISTLRNASGVLFVCEMPPPTAFVPRRGRVLALDGVQDPGNVGGILRSAEALGADGLWLLDGCADAYNPKTVRAAMGSLFRLPVWRGSAEDFFAAMRAAGLPVYAAALDPGAQDIGALDLSRAAVVIGSEGAGVSRPVREGSRACLRIPMRGGAESLNAAVAAAIVLWEMNRACRCGTGSG